MLSSRLRFLALMFAFLASLSGLCYLLLAPARQMQDWRPVDGIIVESRTQVVDRPDAHDQLYWKARVDYRYRLDGRDYRQDKVFAVDTGLPGDRSAAEDLVHRYPTGKHVTVYVDPANPTTAVLVKGGGDQIGLARWMLAVLTLLFGASLLRRLHRQYRFTRRHA